MKDTLITIAKKLSLDGSAEGVKILGTAIATGSMAATGTVLLPLIGCILLHVAISKLSKDKKTEILKQLNDEFKKLSKKLPNSIDKVRDTQIAGLEKLLNIEIGQEKLKDFVKDLQEDVKVSKLSLDEISEKLDFSAEEIRNFSLLIENNFEEVSSQICQLHKDHEKHEEKEAERYKKTLEELDELKIKVTPEMVDNRNDVILKADFSLSEKIGEIPRNEVKQIWDNLWKEEGKKSVLLSGEAGIGKSGILHQLAIKLKEEEIPYLYFKPDTTSMVETTMELGRNIFNGIAISPVKAMDTLYGSKPSVIIIDQLDEISDSSGRTPEFFNCIALLLKEMALSPKMRVVMGCRKFDLDHDYRFRKLIGDNGIAEEIEAKLLPDEVVKELIEEIGLDSNLLKPGQVNLLQSPLHLSLLVQTLPDTPREKVFDFITANDLFDRYWTVKENAVSKRIAPSSCKWPETIDLVTSYMSREQQLSIPRLLLDDEKLTATAMESEHVLTGDDQAVRFFHATFFDYAFARRFCTKNQDLLSVLLSSEQHLFRRDQVKQILYLLREIKFPGYLSSMEQIIGNPNIRYHIKKTAIQFLATIDKPTSDEWDILSRFIDSDDPAIKRDLRATLTHSTQWLLFFHEQGLLIPWLKADKMRDLIFDGLSWYAKNIPEVLLAVLEHFKDELFVWQKNWYHLFQSICSSGNRELFQKFISFIDDGQFDDPKVSQFWSIIYDLPEKEPDWAAEVIGHYLERQFLQLPDEFTYSIHIFDYENDSCRKIIATAKNSPEKFTGYVFPIFLKVLDKYKDPSKHIKGCIATPAWAFRFYRSEDDIYDMDTALLTGLENSLISLASKHPKLFTKYENQLLASDFEPAKFLLLQAYTAGAKSFADKAIDYVIENPSRLEYGYSAGGDGDFQYWPGYSFVKAVSKHCSGTSLKKLLKILLLHEPENEKRKGSKRFRGYFQFMMLSGIKPSNRTAKIGRKLNELQRKMSRKTVKKPNESGRAFTVVSPIPEEKIKIMNDRQWLNAIQKYNSEEREEKRYEDFAKGGALELARELEKETRNSPLRFCNLLKQFPEGTHSTYYEHVIMGLHGSDCSECEQDVFEVIQICHSLPDKPFGRWMPPLIADFAKTSIPDKILSIAAWYATEDPNPTKDEKGYGISPSHGLIGAGMNCVRGVASECIASLTFDNPERQQFFSSTTEKLMTDFSIPVRALAVKILIGMLNKDRETAIKQFAKLINTDDDRLLATQYIENFMMYASKTHIKIILPFVERMIKSKNDDVREAGGRMLMSCRLDDESLSEPLQTHLKSEDIYIKKGIATVAAANVLNGRYAELCQAVLPPLLDDKNKEVCDTAAQCIYQISADDIGNIHEFIKSFYESKAFLENTYALISLLKETTSKLPDITFDICDHLIKLSKDDRQPSNRFGDTSILSSLLFRIYRQTTAEKVQSRCLDLIDGMLKSGLYGVDKELNNFDR